MKPSSFVLFARKIKGTGMNRIKVHREFLRQVDKEDWAGSNKDQIVSYLEKLAEKA